MTILQWRDATTQDRSPLAQFECTPRIKRRGRTTYPFPVERVVETAIRRVNPRCNDSSVVRVGEDDHGIAAVCCVGWNAGYDTYLVEVVAVALRHRRTGGIVALEALDQAIQWAASRAASARQQQFTVAADVDPRNLACTRMLSHARFTKTSEAEDRHVWIYDSAALPFG